MTFRLLNLAYENWEDLDGYSVGNNFDLEDLPLGRLSNFVWWWLTSGRGETDPKEVEKFRIRLWRPPAGVEVTDERSPWSASKENEAFSALKNAMGGSLPEPNSGS